MSISNSRNSVIIVLLDLYESPLTAVIVLSLRVIYEWMVDGNDIRKLNIQNFYFLFKKVLNIMVCLVASWLSTKLCNNNSVALYISNQLIGENICTWLSGTTTHQFTLRWVSLFFTLCMSRHHLLCLNNCRF